MIKDFPNSIEISNTPTSLFASSKLVNLSWIDVISSICPLLVSVTIIELNTETFLNYKSLEIISLFYWIHLLKFIQFPKSTY